MNGDLFRNMGRPCFDELSTNGVGGTSRNPSSVTLTRGPAIAWSEEWLRITQKIAACKGCDSPPHLVP